MDKTTDNSILPASARADSIFPVSILEPARSPTSGAIPRVQRSRGNRVGRAGHEFIVMPLALPVEALEIMGQAVAAAGGKAAPEDSHAAPARDGYMNAQGAADYMGVNRKRIYDLTSARALVPDGYDGRTPLYSRATLDAYVRSASN